MNTYILVEPKRKELITAINDVEKSFVLCVNKNCFSEDLKRKSIDVLMKIDEVVVFINTTCHTMDEVSHRKLTCDNFLNDAQELLREMSFAVSKCF
jgi:hypothetical protein